MLKRELRQATLENALQITKPQFVKHSVSKAFPASVYGAEKLAAETSKIHRDSLVHIGEPVEFEREFRCFVSQSPRDPGRLGSYKRYLSRESATGLRSNEAGEVEGSLDSHSV